MTTLQNKTLIGVLVDGAQSFDVLNRPGTVTGLEIGRLSRGDQLVVHHHVGRRPRKQGRLHKRKIINITIISSVIVWSFFKPFGWLDGERAREGRLIHDQGTFGVPVT